MSEKKFWGWGYEDFEIAPTLLEQYKTMLQFSLGIKEFVKKPIPELSDIELRTPRFSLPPSFSNFCTAAKKDRAAHSYGKSFRDIWRAVYGRFDNPPDYIAYPKTEQEIQEIMNFAQANRVALIPFGGGSSVVGGVEPTRSDKYSGVITIDMKHFNQVLEIDRKSRTARIQAGIYGPALEAVLKPQGLTIRHFPQSFEFSTLGGWIATRSGGHFATLFTHIDEFVEAIRMVSPKGIMESRRLPGSGAGPSEERLISGSEGTFGIITEAWMRLQDIPKYKATTAVNFKDFNAGVEACRQISQSGLFPTNARLVSPMEAFSNGLGDGSNTVLILGFESAHHQVEPLMKEALSICSKLGGSWNEKKSGGKKDDAAAGRWKKSFLQAPYLRDELVRLGLVIETFETAVTWDQFEHFHQEIERTAIECIRSECGKGIITCRFTHLYPDGPAPYYTVIAKGTDGKQLEQWDTIKSAVSDKIIELGGTITHHHAVGKDHRPWYEKQRSAPYGKVLTNIKKTFDPEWILNPDVLIRSDE